MIPGSKLYSLPLVYYEPLGIPGEGYTISSYFIEGNTAGNVLAWFNSSLAAKGYEFVGGVGLTSITTQNGTVQYGVIVFKKGDEGVGVWAVSGSSVIVEGKTRTVYIIVKDGIEGLTGIVSGGSVETLPSHDLVSGEDPVQQRYPGSVMLRYDRDEKGFPTRTFIEYGSADDMNRIADWYKETLSSKGWNITGETRDPERIEIDAVKGSETLYLEITPPNDVRAYTLIHMEINSYKPPSQDLAGSKMISYSSVSSGGVNATSITYVTGDPVDQVVAWYKNYLNESGWSIVVGSETPGEITIAGYKGSETVGLTIASKAYGAYTEITVEFYQYTSG
ncbi:MAG: hypothetical protein OWQ48_00940 [Desulfurococcus sp.]|nr:hypothetical protein [Desulfurococcus sp.]